MRLFILDDDISVVKIIENLIEEYNLGEVIGTSTNSETAVDEIIQRCPDIVIVDLLMPNIDGNHLVKLVKDANPLIHFIMISQVSNKAMISKAYQSGVSFYIHKPLNRTEIKMVLENVIKQIELEHNFKIIEKMFRGISQNEHKGSGKLEQIKRIKGVFSRLGIMGEKGGEDVITICEYMIDHDINSFDFKVRDICELLNDNPKAMEQRLRRAINRGLINLANVGIEDYMNENFMRFSNSIYDFENVKAEMDCIRGKRPNGGKISVKKFIDNILLMTNEVGHSER